MKRNEAAETLVNAFLRLRPDSNVFTRGERPAVLDDFMAELQRYAPLLLAVTLRLHLAALLEALLEGGICTREEVRDFCRELEREALQYETK
jgi:hypothetical protein